MGKLRIKHLFECLKIVTQTITIIHYSKINYFFFKTDKQLFCLQLNEGPLNIDKCIQIVYSTSPINNFEQLTNFTMFA